MPADEVWAEPPSALLRRTLDEHGLSPERPLFVTEDATAAGSYVYLVPFLLGQEELSTLRRVCAAVLDTLRARTLVPLQFEVVPAETPHPRSRPVEEWEQEVWPQLLAGAPPREPLP